MKISKKRYIQAFCLVVVALALVRAICPNIAGPMHDQATTAEADTIAPQPSPTPQPKANAQKATATAPKTSPNFSRGAHPILSVPSYRTAFPDSQDVQLAAAQRWGVTPVADRQEAESRKAELVYIGSCPWFQVDPLTSSIPYLVPRAQLLLQDMGQAYFDSLYAKRIPLHQFIVTSVLRTQNDVRRLRQYNRNATENSCHQYGTTFDICYNRYVTVADPTQPAPRATRNDTLKWVLAEVLRDFREQGRCYVKYEVKQGCFHITTR